MVDVANADVVAILTRAPSAGGKTRLFAALGVESDPVLLTALLLDTCDGARSAGARQVIAVTPSSAVGELEALLPGMAVTTQPEGTLGERMRETMRRLFDGGARRVALIGSDLPAITPARIDTAFAHLADVSRTLVLGPAVDGGYYLIAARDVPPVFDDIAWGTAHVLAATRDRAEAQGWRVVTIDPLSDVDTVEDLELLASTRPSSRTARWWKGRGRM